MVYFFNFGSKKLFLDNLALSHTTSNEFLATHQSLEKTNDTTPRNSADRQKDRRKVQQVFLWKVLELIFCQFSSATDKIFIMVGLLGSHY